MKQLSALLFVLCLNKVMFGDGSLFVVTNDKTGSLMINHTTKHRHTHTLTQSFTKCAIFIIKTTFNMNFPKCLCSLFPHIERSYH